jgi:hypothetical protein
MEGLDESIFRVREAMLTARSTWQQGGLRTIAPNGEIVAGHLIGEGGSVATELSAQAVIEVRQNLDAGGHYSRKDGLRLEVLGPNTAAAR